jgi:hypothetical protein
MTQRDALAAGLSSSPGNLAHIMLKTVGEFASSSVKTIFKLIDQRLQLPVDQPTLLQRAEQAVAMLEQLTLQQPPDSPGSA